MGTGSGDTVLGPNEALLHSGKPSLKSGTWERQISLRGSLAPQRTSSVSVRPRLARAPRGNAAAGTPQPRNFFHPVRHTLPPTQTGFEQPGNRRPLGSLPVKGGPGAPAGPILLVIPVRHCADPGTARSRPLAARAPGSCGGGEVVARRRAPPPGGLCARASARTARAEHVAPGLRVRP